MGNKNKINTYTNWCFTPLQNAAKKAISWRRSPTLQNWVQSNVFKILLSLKYLVTVKQNGPIYYSFKHQNTNPSHLEKPKRSAVLCGRLNCHLWFGHCSWASVLGRTVLLLIQFTANILGKTEEVSSLGPSHSHGRPAHGVTDSWSGPVPSWPLQSSGEQTTRWKISLSLFQINNIKKKKEKKKHRQTGKHLGGHLR